MRKPLSAGPAAGLGHKGVIEPLSEEDGGGFLATVPELPGCMSDGETRAEALANVELQEEIDTVRNERTHGN